MQIIEARDQKSYTDFILTRGASLLQSWEWGEFQRRLNRRVWRVFLTSNTGNPLLAAQVVRMPLPRGRSYFYCPRGPVVAPSAHGQKIWRLFLDKLEDFILVEKPIFLRVDPPETEFTGKFKLEEMGFRKLSWEIQPKNTLLLDLHMAEEQLLHQMKPKTRYNIHLSTRKGVVVEELPDAKKMRVFWELMRETTERDGFSPHPYLYYVNLLESLGPRGMAELFIASYHRRPLAAAIVTYFGSCATYLHGASSDNIRGAMAPHLIQWAAIRAAKQHGMHWYDLGGIAPEGARSHPWSGITRFKKGFGGREVAYVGAYDLLYDAWWYRLYRLGRWANRIRGKKSA